MSIRLAWHSEGWNGHFCKKPCENSYCVGQHSYPGDLIASTRDLEFETIHAGESCASVPCGAACGLSVNAFGSESVQVRVDPPSFWKAEDADGIMLTLPPYTVCTWCYEQMYNDDVAAKGNTSRKYDYDKRKENERCDRVEILELLRQKGIPVGLATSTHRVRTDRRLALCGLGEYFSAVVTGDEVSKGKPDPEIYCAVCGKLNVSPNACLAVEDSRNGILSAHHAGLKVAMIPDMVPPTAELEEIALQKFSSLLELKAYLQALSCQTLTCDGRTYYYITVPSRLPAIPKCLFLAGFDPLLLGYEKKDSPFLPPAYVKMVFNNTGIVFPALLRDGTVQGKCKEQPRHIEVTAFAHWNKTQIAAIQKTANTLWPDKPLQWTHAPPP